MRPTFLALLSLLPLSLSAPPPAQHPLSLSLSPPSSSLSPGFSSLTSLLTSSRQSSLFYDYLRTAAPLSLHARLSAPPPSFVTLLVPTNQAILALQRRPHQGPPGPVVVDGAREGVFKVTVVDAREEEEAREAYLGRWVERHAVAGEVELEGEGWEGRKWETLDGAKIWFELGEDGETRVLQPGGIEVVGVDSVSRFATAWMNMGRPAGRRLTLTPLSRLKSDNGRLYHLAGSLSIDA